MALKDSAVLIPECPKCEDVSVRFQWWEGAWRTSKRRMRYRVYLRPDQTRTISCMCTTCMHQWDEYVRGVARDADGNEIESNGIVVSGSGL